MILIGMFDSPFVRRVAVSMNVLEMAFEHRNWSVGKDFELIRQFNPLGRVPTLVQPDGESLIDSSAILDFLDEYGGPGAGAPAALGQGAPRGVADHIARLGAAEKGGDSALETAFRPGGEALRPWMERCRTRCTARSRSSIVWRRLAQGVAGRRSHDAGRYHRNLRISRFCVDALAMNRSWLMYPGLAGLRRGARRCGVPCNSRALPSAGPGRVERAGSPECRTLAKHSGILLPRRSAGGAARRPK